MNGSLEEGMLIIPVRMPIDIGGAVNVLERLREKQDIGSIALQLDESKQSYLNQVFSDGTKIDNTEIGYFYPIVNFATSRNKPSFALGGENIRDLVEAMNTYKRLSEKHLEFGSVAYVCSVRNSTLLRNVKVVN